MGIFSQNELILMIAVVGILLVFIVVLTILDLKEYKNTQDKEEEFKPEKEEFIQQIESENSRVEIESIVKEKPIKLEEKNMEELEIPFIDNEEMPINPVINEEKDDALFQEVLEDFGNNSYVEEVSNNQVNIYGELDNVSKTIIDFDEDKKVVSFEEEQERTAIISLDDLINKSESLYSENEINQYDDGNEPISLDEVFNMYQKDEKVEEVEKVPEVVQAVVEEKKELYTKKENIPFISSIYGLEKNDMSFENTASYEKLSREQSNEFMQRLREMSENK